MVCWELKVYEILILIFFVVFPTLAEIIAEPLDFAVTFPVELTAATDGFELFHVTVPLPVRSAPRERESPRAMLMVMDLIFAVLEVLG